jgi:putative transcriptional regulator
LIFYQKICKRNQNKFEEMVHVANGGVIYMRNRISYLIKAKGLKQNHIAKSLGVTEQTFSNWCRNVTQPDLLQAYQLSKLLNVPMEDLVEEEND